MQYNKIFYKKLFISFRFSNRIQIENFYRRLKEALNLEFLYPLTQKFYGESRQKALILSSNNIVQEAHSSILGNLDFAHNRPNL